MLCGRRPEIVESINERASTILGTKKASSCPDDVCGRRSIQPRRSPAPTSSCSRFRRRRCAQNLAVWTPLFPADALLVSLIKGVELGTTKRMSEVISEVADVPAERVAVVTGPNLAREIAERQPGASVVACTDADNAELLQSACQTGVLPAVHEHRRHRLRARRGGEERHRRRRRDRRRHGIRRQLEGFTDHPRARRNGTSRCRRWEPTR